MKITEEIRTNKASLVLLWMLVFSPALLQLIAVACFSVDVPVWDQWEYVGFFQKLHQGTLTLGDLFAQQLEYRQFFPNLSFVLLGAASKWDVRWEMWLMLVLALLISFALCRLLYVTLGRSGKKSWLGMLLLNLLIFSPVQLPNWLFGVQIVYLLGNACFVFALVTAASSVRIQLRLPICLLLAVAASFSSVNGVLTWLLVLPVLLLAEVEGGGNNRMRRWCSSAVWVVGFAGCVALYLYGYKNPPGHPNLLLFLERPIRALLYCFLFLGRPLDIIPFLFEGSDKLDWYRFLSQPYSVFLGLVLTAAWISAAVLVLCGRQEKKLLQRALPWLMLGLFAIATSAMTMLGRLGFGISQGLSPRYTSFALFLPVSLIGLALLLHEELLRRGRLPKNIERCWRRIGAAAALLLLVQSVYYAGIGVQKMVLHREKTLRVKACLAFAAVLDDECIRWDVYPVVEQLKLRAAVLNGLGYLRPPLRQRAVIDSSSSDSVAGGSTGLAASEFGKLEFAGLNENGLLHLSGTGNLPTKKLFFGLTQGPDAVLLSYQQDNQVPQIFGLARIEDAPEKIRYLGRPEEPLRWRWTKELSSARLPKGKMIVRAWAYDAMSNQAFPVEGEQVVVNP